MFSVSHLPPITSEDGPSHDPAAAISPLSSIRERALVGWLVARQKMFKAKEEM